MLHRVGLVRIDISEERIAKRRVLQLLVIAEVLSWVILFTLMMESIFSTEMAVLTRATRHHITEGGILQYSVASHPVCLFLIYVPIIN
jgi:hypothetical protein